MSISLSSHPQALTGVHLMRGRTTLAIVRHVEPDGVHSGCVHMQISAADPEALFEGTGSMQVHDANQDATYQVQALRCRATNEGYHLMVTTLGEAREGYEEQAAEDYLVIKKQEPVLIRDLVIADSACDRGPHVRFEVTDEAWSNLPVRFQASRACVCGAPVSVNQSNRSAGAGEHRWTFMDLRAERKLSFRSGVIAEVVRLASRCTHRVDLHVGMPGDPSRPMVAMGHVVATERWKR